MVTSLYETLGIQVNASRDEVRKAYRRLALQTHPDRLPPGATEEEKQKSEEAFRKVNNAYEVLVDEDKRKAYDRYGQWPPEPQEEPTHRHRPHRSHSHRHSGYRSTFFDDPFAAPSFGSSSRAWQTYGFTDPFVLFESIFGDMQRQFEEFPRTDPIPSRGFHSQFGGFPSPAFGNSFLDFPMQMTASLQPNFQSSFQSSSGFLSQMGGNGQWVSESRMTRTINGVTESVCKRTDSRGNEHVTYSYPDGRKKHLINGIEQPANSGDHSLPPPPYSATVPVDTGRRIVEQGSSRTDRNQHHADRYSPTKHNEEHGRERVLHRDRSHRDRERERRHHTSSSEHDHDKKRWWQG